MDCPRCGAAGTHVRETRLGAVRFEVRRRRVCRLCKQRFVTVELPLGAAMPVALATLHRMKQLAKELANLIGETPES